MLTADRSDPISIHPSRRLFPVAAGVKIFGGALVVLDEDGFARPARDDVPTDTAVGWAKRGVDNTSGANGAAVIETRFGIMRLRNDTVEPVDLKLIQKVVYILDDNTVSASTKNDTRSIAGVLLNVVSEDGRVWIEVQFVEANPMRGPHVRELHDDLREIGYAIPLCTANEDGHLFTSFLVNAVRAFKARHMQDLRLNDDVDAGVAWMIKAVLAEYSRGPI